MSPFTRVCILPEEAGFLAPHATFSCPLKGARAGVRPSTTRHHRVRSRVVTLWLLKLPGDWNNLP